MEIKDEEINTARLGPAPVIPAVPPCLEFPALPVVPKYGADTVPAGVIHGQGHAARFR